MVNCVQCPISTGNLVNLLKDKYKSVNCVQCPISTGKWVKRLLDKLN